MSYGVILEGEVTARDLYQSYIQYHNSTNTSDKPISSNKFGRLMIERGLKRDKRRDCSYYVGISLKRT